MLIGKRNRGKVYFNLAPIGQYVLFRSTNYVDYYSIKKWIDQFQWVAPNNRKSLFKISVGGQNLVYRIAPQSRQMRCFRRLPSSPWRLKVTKASPCCQPSPISLEPQYWHRVIGICFIVSTPLSGVLQTHNTEEASGSLLKLSMQNGKKSLSNSEKATAFAVALPLLMICCPWFRNKVYVLSIIRISIAATCARVALPWGSR